MYTSPLEIQHERLNHRASGNFERLLEKKRVIIFIKIADNRNLNHGKRADSMISFDFLLVYFYLGKYDRTSIMCIGKDLQKWFNILQISQKIFTKVSRIVIIFWKSYIITKILNGKIQYVKLLLSNPKVGTRISLM